MKAKLRRLEQKLEAGLRWLWQKIRVYPVITIGVIIAIFVYAVWRLGWDWTGFNSGTNQIIITSTSKGSYTATLSQPPKSLWDWLQLLIVPAILAFGAVWFTIRHNHDVGIAVDNQREAALQEYINKMDDLILGKDLCKVESSEEEKCKIARARTLTVLRHLDPFRKRSVLSFLKELGLIDKDKRGKNKPIVDLKDADLSKADLYQVDLSGADLRDADLRGATLLGARLSGADLRGADLKDAKNITTEELEKQAKSLNGATMSDGSIHA